MTYRTISVRREYNTVLPPTSSHGCPSPPLLPASAQMSDIIFVTALEAALVCQTLRKVPPAPPPACCSLLAPSLRQWLRHLQRLLPPVKSPEVQQGVRGAVRNQLGAEMPAALCHSVSQGSPVEGIWRQKGWISNYRSIRNKLTKGSFYDDHQRWNDFYSKAFYV